MCITDINGSELERARADMVADGSEVVARVLDVADRDAFEAMVARVAAAWGQLDIARALRHLHAAGAV